MPVIIGNVTATTASGTSVSPSLATVDGGNPPTRGDLILAVFQTDFGGTTDFLYVTDSSPRPWVIANQGYFGNRTSMMWKFWEDGDDTSPIFVAPTTTNMIAGVTVIRGADPIKPVASINFNYTFSTVHTINSDTTPVNNCLVLAWYCVDANAAGTPDTGWTEQVDVGVSGQRNYMQSQGFATPTATGAAAVTIGAVAQEGVNRSIIIQEEQPPPVGDIRVKAGTISSPTSTGDQDTTGFGFDVKAIIMWSTRRSSNGVTADAEIFIGVGADDGVTTAAGRCAGAWQDSGTTTHFGFSDISNVVKHYFTSNSTLGSPDLEAAFSSIANGFRLNWTAVDSSAWDIHYMAFGGDDLEAAVGTAAANVNPFAGLPWRPNLPVFTCGQCTAAVIDEIRTDSMLHHGWLDAQSSGTYLQMSTFDATQGEATMREDIQQGQVLGGGLTWFNSWVYTTTTGWFFNGSNTDVWYFLGLRNTTGETNFPAGVHMFHADDSNVDDTRQALPLSYGGKAEPMASMLAIGRPETNFTQQAQSFGMGYVDYTDGITQHAVSIGKSGNVAERASDDAQVLIGASNGDLDTMTKEAEFLDHDIVNWNTNDSDANLVGICSFGRLKCRISSPF